MTARNRLIPFAWLPGAWGLKGKALARAQAEYELEGYDLAIKLAILDSPTQDDFDLAKTQIDFEYNFMSEREYEYAIARFIPDETEREIQLLKLDYQHTAMKDLEYDKRLATLKKESWVSVIDLNVREETGNFELDWNDTFVEELKEVGFTGLADEDVVNSWFSRICRDIALSEYGGVGDFDEKLAKADGDRSADEADAGNGRRIVK
jgi:hypothetical protein